MFTVLSLVLVVFGAWITRRALLARAEAKRSQAWPTAEGEIVTSGVESSEFQDDDHGTIRKFTPAITYVYRVRGAERRGTHIAVGLSNLYSEWAEAEQRARQYPVGKKIQVYYDPRGTMSVLEPGNTQSANTIFGIGLGLIFTGLLLLGIAFKHR
jgi:Protein of unknown function (DUF3592)